MTATLRLVALLAAGLALTACATSQGSQSSPTRAVAPAAGGSSTTAAPSTTDSSASAQDSQAVRAENMIADCMKAKGFSYVPHPLLSSDMVSASNLAARDPALTPYAQLRAWRAKYGFGIFSPEVYPNDPNVAEPAWSPSDNPNNAIYNALAPAQKQAYDLALNGVVAGHEKKSDGSGSKPLPDACALKASLAVYGTQPQDPNQGLLAKQAEQAFQTDPGVLTAAQGYASCLVSHGYRVTSVKPGTIEQTVSNAAQALHDKGGLTPQQGLTKEIKMALDDVDCGKAYEEKARPLVQKMLDSGVG